MLLLPYPDPQSERDRELALRLWSDLTSSASTVTQQAVPQQVWKEAWYAETYWISVDEHRLRRNDVVFQCTLNVANDEGQPVIFHAIKRGDSFTAIRLPPGIDKDSHAGRQADDLDRITLRHFAALWNDFSLKIRQRPDQLASLMDLEAFQLLPSSFWPGDVKSTTTADRPGRYAPWGQALWLNAVEQRFLPGDLVVQFKQLNKHGLALIRTRRIVAVIFMSVE